MKIVIIVFLIAIIVSLASGLRFLIQDTTADDKRTVRALTWRVVLSIAFIAFLAISFYAGWIHPHGLQPR